MGLLTYIKRFLGDERRDSQGRLKPDPKKRLTPAERETNERVSQMRYLKKHDPDGYLEMVRSRYIRHDPQNPITMLKEMADLQKTAQKLGLSGSTGSGDSFDKLIEKLPEMMVALGPTIGAIATGQAPIVQHAPQLDAPRRRRRQAESPEEAPTDTPAEASSQEPANTDESVEDAPVSIITPAMAAAFARSNLENKSPRDAAQWILSQNHPAVDGMVKVICETPDPQLFATLRAHAVQANEPALIDLMAWFESRGEWTLQIAGYIRRQKAPKGRAKLRAL